MYRKKCGAAAGFWLRSDHPHPASPIKGEGRTENGSRDSSQQGGGEEEDLRVLLSLSPGGEGSRFLGSFGQGRGG